MVNIAKKKSNTNVFFIHSLSQNELGSNVHGLRKAHTYLDMQWQFMLIATKIINAINYNFYAQYFWNGTEENQIRLAWYFRSISVVFPYD